MSARNRSLTACTSCSHLSGLTCDHARKSLSCICRNMSTSPVTTSSKSASASERSSPTACLPSSGNIGVELPSGCPPSTGKTVYGQHHPGANGKNSRGKPFYTAPCWPTKTTPLYLWSNTEKHQLWLCYTISIMTERKEKKNPLKYPTSDTKLWRAVCKNLYLVSPQMGNKGIYRCFRCATFVCVHLDSSFDKQLCVCTMWTNIHPVHPSCVPLKVQSHCYCFVPTRDITFTSPVALSKPQDIYMSNVRRWAHTAVNKLCSRHVI